MAKTADTATGAGNEHMWRVGGVPTRPDERVWVLDAGAPRLALESDQSPLTRCVVTVGDAELSAAHFSGSPLPDGYWMGLGLAATPSADPHDPMLMGATVAGRPELEDRVARATRTTGTMDHLDAIPTVTRTRDRVHLRIDGPATVDALGSIAASVRDRGGRVLVVGGAVRDALWDHHHGSVTTIKDVDIEVFGVPAHDLHAMVLQAHPDTKLVGAQFGVLKVESLDLDISLPRRERKTGATHTDFEVDTDHTMTPGQAAARRDFTMNAISWDPLTGEVVDPVGGARDLRARLLRHVGPQFAEDALRVLRGGQFVARFGLTAHPETIELCASLLPGAAELSSERVWDEVGKLLLKGQEPGRGLWFAERVGWTHVISPQLAALRGVEQDPTWHPEGNVFTHTCHVLDFWSAHLRTGDPYEDMVVALAALAHDFGKASTTEFAKGRWRAHGHEEAGVEPTREWLADVQLQDVPGTRRQQLVKDVTALVASHLAPVQFHQREVSDSAIRRLAQKVGRIDRLVRVAHADQGGRPPLNVGDFEAGRWLLERAASLDVVSAKPVGLLRGQDLIDEFDEKPGKHFAPLIAAALDAQLDGLITSREDAIEWARHRLAAE